MSKKKVKENYFTPEEIVTAKSGSIPFPLIVYSGTDVNKVVEITEIGSLSGMAKNNGIPTEITMYKRHKTSATETVTTRLTYRLVENVELPF